MLFGSIQLHHRRAIDTLFKDTAGKSRETSPTARAPVNPSYRPISPPSDDERLRRGQGQGRRRFFDRIKSFSDPQAYSPTNMADEKARARVNLFESLEASRHNANGAHHGARTPEDVCCSKCTRSGMEWDKYKPSAVVSDYAAVSTQNSKFRKHMEDECVAIPKFKAYHGDPAKSCFFAVYDGHGGSFCSRYAAKNFHARLSTLMASKVSTRQRESESSTYSVLTSSDSTAASDADGPYLLSPEDIESCYVDAFATIDEELGNYEESSACGSTAVTCLIRKHNGRTSFHVANVGDSRAILYSNGKTSRLTVDHKATNEDEVKRIRSRNGIIFNKRVAGVISITRALGQTDEKEFITADPHLASGEVTSKDSFLVLASDGVSDVFSDEDVAHFVRERLDRGEKSITICKSLLDEAKAQGAMDNMTAVLICFSGAEH